ncbi:MAG UNVERIFIED_CONTAM: hypothetical protein LVT10_15625 [Anaerolineae bacterium]
MADVRAREYEALREKITQDQWKPDYGPASVGTAGAVAIGARQAPFGIQRLFGYDRCQHR